LPNFAILWPIFFWQCKIFFASFEVFGRKFGHLATVKSIPYFSSLTLHL
jgi:hypothetical protein